MSLANQIWEIIKPSYYDDTIELKDLPEWKEKVDKLIRFLNV